MTAEYARAQMSRTEWRMMLLAEYEAWVRSQAQHRRRPAPACNHDPRAHARRATRPQPFQQRR